MPAVFQTGTGPAGLTLRIGTWLARVDLNHRTAKGPDLQSGAFDHSATRQKPSGYDWWVLLVDLGGFEPPTFCLQGRHSPTELQAQTLQHGAEARI